MLRFQNSRLMTRLASSGTVTYIHIHIFVSSYSVDVFVAILRDTHNMNICPNILIFCGRSDLDTGSRIPSEHTWPPHILPIWTGLSETRSALSPLIIMIHIQHQPLSWRSIKRLSQLLKNCGRAQRRRWHSGEGISLGNISCHTFTPATQVWNAQTSRNSGPVLQPLPHSFHSRLSIYD